MQTLTGYAYNHASHRPSAKLQTPSLKFGDAVYLRNSKFEKSLDIPQDSFRLQQKLQRYTGPSKEIADFMTQKEKPLYDETGRFARGQSALPVALTYATRQYELRQADVQNNPTQETQIAKDLAGVKLANLQLASDNSEKANQEAFRLLSGSLNRLIALGYPKQSVSPVFIHGLYNRGTYAFNNELYRANQELWTPAEIQRRDDHFEGLAIGRKSSVQLKKMKEGMPYLEKAIELADSIPDHHLSKSEYMIAKGEMLHAIAHLSEDQSEDFYNHSQESRDSFAAALKILEEIAAKDFTPRHQELKRKLEEIKIPHLCDHQHRANANDGSSVCGTSLPQQHVHINMDDIINMLFGR